MSTLQNAEYHIFRRFGVEFTTALIILLTFIVLRNAENTLTALTALYLVGLTAIYLFRKI